MSTSKIFVWCEHWTIQLLCMGQTEVVVQWYRNGGDVMETCSITKCTHMLFGATKVYNYSLNQNAFTVCVSNKRSQRTAKKEKRQARSKLVQCSSFCVGVWRKNFWQILMQILTTVPQMKNKKKLKVTVWTQTYETGETTQLKLMQKLSLVHCDDSINSLRSYVLQTA